MLTSSNVRLFVLGGFAFFFCTTILSSILLYCFLLVLYLVCNVVVSKDSLLRLTLSNLPNVVDCLLVCGCKRGDCSSEAWMVVCHSVRDGTAILEQKILDVARHSSARG